MELDIGTYHTIGYIANDINDLIQDIGNDTGRENDVRELIRARDMLRDARDLIDRTIELEE